MKKRPVVIADRGIPYITEFFGSKADVTLLDSEQITPSCLTNADALLARTVTQINKTLLENSPIQFVGSATAGIDHLDSSWLQSAGITWAHAPGANAQAVAEYVICNIALLQVQNKLPTNSLTVGVIGVGNVGQALNRLLRVIGAKVILIDPCRDEREPQFTSAHASELNTADLISIHTPLTRTGAHPTHHLIDQNFLNHLKPNCVLVNAARGEIANSQALIDSNEITMCLDVFSNEPNPNPQLVNKSLIATPHIAGYSQQAKQRATEMVYKQFCDYFKLEYQPISLTTHEAELHLPSASTWQEVVLACYNPLTDSKQLKDNINAFAQLRNNYLFRNEFKAFKVHAPQLLEAEREILYKLDLRLEESL